MGTQRRLHLIELNPKAAHLHLKVRPAQQLQTPVVPVPGKVARAVHTPRALDEGIGNKAFGGQVRLVTVTACHAVSSQVQLADHPGGYRFARRAEHVRTGVGNRASDEDRSLRLTDLLQGRPDGRLGRTVQVPHRTARGQQLACQVARQGLATAQNLQPRRTPPAAVQQQTPGHRRCLHHRGAARGELPAQCLAVHCFIRARQHHLRTNH